MARATLKDVAQEAGVSSATVSYILNGKRSISEETKARVMEAIKKLDYVPDLNARGLTMRDSKLIGVVVPQTEPGERLMFQNSFYSEILVRGVTEQDIGSLHSGLIIFQRVNHNSHFFRQTFLQRTQMKAI